MAIVRPFAAIRPKAEFVKKVVAPPYDVLDREEASQLALNNPFSFLHVSRSEIDLPEIKDPHSKEVYQKARENLEKFINDGVFIKEDKACFYIYELTMLGRTQTGIVATFSIDEYQNNTIKKHELTLHEKEQDRLDHFNTCSAHTEPVFLTYHKQNDIQNIIDSWSTEHEAIFDFISDDGIGHKLWLVDETSVVNKLEKKFLKVNALYIADGHHRSASASRAGFKRRENTPNYSGKEEFNYFLAVLFPHDQLKIYDYNRLVADLNNLDKDSFLEKLSEFFDIDTIGTTSKKPDKPHTFSMYLDGLWYSLKLKNIRVNSDNPVDKLDVSILQKLVLDPILGIADPRTDNRIEFVGGIRGLEELEKKVDGGMAVAFALYPPSMEDLLEIADMNMIMPPKSTWFEPKLGSGLFVHEF